MFEASDSIVGTQQPKDQPESGLLSSMIVDQASVNQTAFWPVLNILTAVSSTEAAYQFDTSYACCLLTKLIVIIERRRYPYQAM